MADRWKPTRAGIRNVWEYDDQVFDFADGRLILRGPNGSGKSNALALLFPFLFDGTMSANAMDPFAGGRSMRSLLLGVVRDDDAAQGFRHDRRLGYVWLEFGDGERHVTIGCGARATAEAPNPRSWFFVTPRRVGIDLALDHDGEVHERKRLIEVLGHGAVVDTAEEFRAAVDRAVLGIGGDRHRKLIGLIRVLRRPQLAGKLNLDLLSDVLSSGLPGLADDVLDDIASSLDDLESTQRDLAGVQAAHATVETFLPVYATYLRGEAARRTAAVRTAEAERQRGPLPGCPRPHRTRTHRRRSHGQRRVPHACRCRCGRHRRREDRRHRVASLQRRIEPARTRRGRRSCTGCSRRRRARSTEAGDDHRDAMDSADQAEIDAAESGRRTEESLTALIDAADAGDLAWILPTTDSTDPDRLAAAARSAESSRRDDLREVRRALAADDRAAADLGVRQTEAADAGDEAAAAQARADALDAETARLRTALAAAVHDWAATAPQLDETQSMVDHIDRLGDADAGTLADQYRTLTAPARDGLVSARTAVTTTVDAAARRLEELRAERDRVAEEIDAGPEPPPWRSTSRDGRAGAPLWACCDFADTLDDPSRAALEAALDAAGLLDAWVSPDGTAFDAHDSWLVADPSATDEPGHATLRSALVATPAPGAGLDSAAVDSVLDSVTLGRLGVAVDTEGRFRLGPLAGRAAKPQADYIGATARAARRARRLAALDAEINDTVQALAAAETEVDRLTAELTRLDAAPDTLPTTQPLLGALAAASTAAAESPRHCGRRRSRSQPRGRRRRSTDHRGEVAPRHRHKPPTADRSRRNRPRRASRRRFRPHRNHRDRRTPARRRRYPHRSLRAEAGRRAGRAAGRATTRTGRRRQRSNRARHAGPGPSGPDSGPMPKPRWSP